MSNNFDGPVILDQLDTYLGFGRLPGQNQSSSARIRVVTFDPSAAGLDYPLGSLVLRTTLGAVSLYQKFGVNPTDWAPVGDGPSSGTSWPGPATVPSEVGNQLVVPPVDGGALQPVLDIPAGRLHEGSQIRVTFQARITVAGFPLLGLGVLIFMAPDAASTPALGSIIFGGAGTGYAVNDNVYGEVILTLRDASVAAPVWVSGLSLGVGAPALSAGGNLSANTVDATIDQQVAVGISTQAGVGNTIVLESVLIELLN